MNCVCSVFPPEAVLHDEDEEKQDTTDHSGDTEAEERSGDVILEAIDAALAGAAGGRVLGPVEGSDLADTSAVIGVFVPRDPVHQSCGVGLISEALRERAELLSYRGRLRCILDAIPVGGDSACRCSDDTASSEAPKAPINV